MNKEVTKETTEFSYDEEGHLVKKVVTVERYDVFVAEQGTVNTHSTTALYSQNKGNNQIFNIDEVKETLGLNRGKENNANKPF